MPNPRSDITQEQYDALIAQGLDDSRIMFLKPATVQRRLAEPPPAPAVAEPVVTPTTERDVSRLANEPSLGAQQRFVLDFMDDEGKQAEAQESMETLRQTQFTSGDDTASPGMSLLQRAPKALYSALFETDFDRPLRAADVPAVAVATGRVAPEDVSPAARLGGALLPQTIQSPQVQEAARRNEGIARQAALEQAKANVRDQRYPFGMDDPRFAEEVEDRTQAILLGKIPSTPSGRNMFVGDETPSDIEQVFSAVGTQQLPGGSMIESPTGYLGRLMSVPTGAAVGVAEAALTDKTVGETVPERITGGFGFIGGGADVGNYIADELELPEDSLSRTLVVGAGGVGGFVGELLTPWDLGLTKGVKFASQASKLARLSRGLDIATTPGDLLFKAGRNTLNERIIMAWAAKPEVAQSADLYSALVFGMREGADAADEVARVFGSTKRARGILGEQGIIPKAASTTDDDFLALVRADMDNAAKGGQRFPVNRTDAADVLAYKAGQRMLREQTTVLGSAPEAMRSLRLTDELIASRSAAADVLGKFQGTWQGLMAAKLKSNPKAYIDAAGKLDAQKLYKDALSTYAESKGVDPTRIPPRDLGVPDDLGLDFMPTKMGGHPRDPQLRLAPWMGRDGKIDIKAWNDTVGSTFDKIARAHPGVRNVGGTRTTRAAGARPAESVTPLTETLATDEQVRKVLTPASLRPGAVRKAVMRTPPAKWLKKNLDPDDLKGVDPEMRTSVKEVGERWDSMDLDFMAKWRAAKAEGLSHADAYAKVVVDAYDTPQSFVYDALVNAYGGFESVADVMALADGVRIMNLLGGAAPAVVRRNMGLLIRAAEKGMLSDAAGEGRELVRALRSALASPSAQQAVSRTARVLELLEEAGPEGIKRLIDDMADGPVKTGLREAFETYEPQLIFKRESATDLFSMSYTQRQLETILIDVLDEYKPYSNVVRAGPDAAAGAKAASRTLDTLAQVAARVGLKLTAKQRSDVVAHVLAQRTMAEKVMNKVPTARGSDLVLPRGTNGSFNGPASLRSIVPDATPEQLAALWSTVMPRVGRDLGVPYKAKSPVFMRDYAAFIESTAQARTPAGELLNQLPIDGATRNFLLESMPLKSFTKLVNEVALRAAKQELSPTNRLLSFMVGAIDDGRLARFAKGGLLSGVLLPTFRYMGMNVLTAPSIIHQTIGSRAAFRSMLLNPDALKAADTVYRGTNMAEVLFSSPTGVVYTRGSVADLLRRVQSQVSTELRRDMFDSWRAYSETRTTGEILKPRGVLRGTRRAGFKMTGVGIEGGVAVAPSLWAEIADATDYYFRAGVLVDALKAGKSPEEALTLAREALLDYGKVSAVEKQTINKLVWFWSFRRENLRTSARAMMDNPQRFRAQYSLAKNGFDYDNRATEHTRDYTEARPFLKLINDPQTRQRYAVMGPALPMLDGVAELVDYMSAFMLLGDSVIYTATGATFLPSGTEVGTSAGQRGIERASRLSEALWGVAADELNPVAALAVGGMTGTVGSFGEFRGVGTYLDPRMLAYVNSTDDMRDIFGGLISIEPIPLEEERAGGGTFQGRQWRVAPESKKAYVLLMSSLLLVGMQRAARDYAPMIMEYRDLEPTKGHGTAMDEVLFQSGLTTPVNLPSTRDRQIENERAIIRMLNEATRD